jgi:hypothetical protein
MFPRIPALLANIDYNPLRAEFVKDNLEPEVKPSRKSVISCSIDIREVESATINLYIKFYLHINNRMSDDLSLPFPPLSLSP